MGSGQQRMEKYRDKVFGSCIGVVTATERGSNGSGDRRTTWRPGDPAPYLKPGSNPGAP